MKIKTEKEKRKLTDETRETICAAMTILKATMKRENCIFGVAIDEKNLNNSELCILEKDSAKSGRLNGFSMSLDKLNRGLI